MVRYLQSQPSSSLLSTQSFSWSQRKCFGIHRPRAHLNISGESQSVLTSDGLATHVVSPDSFLPGNIIKHFVKDLILMVVAIM